MPTIYTIGDSIARGMSQTLGARNFAADGAQASALPAQVAQLTNLQRGDTVVLSIGYNGAGANGLSASDLQTIQAQVTELSNRGAVVLIPGLRTRGMTTGAHGDFARLNDAADGTPGIASRVNQQLGAITGARLIQDCTTQANSQSNGDPHAFAAQLAEICRAAATATTTATSPTTGAPGTTDTTAPATGTPRESDRQADAAQSNSGGGIWESIMGFLRMIGEWISNLFSGLTGGSSNGNSSGQAGGTRTLAQEITDVTTALGVRGQSGALQDNTISDAEKNTIKTELEQVRTALPGTMTDNARAEVSALLTTLREAGIEGSDTILGASLTSLQNATTVSGGASVDAATLPAGLPAASGPRVTGVGN